MREKPLKVSLTRLAHCALRFVEIESFTTRPVEKGPLPKYDRLAMTSSESSYKSDSFPHQSRSAARSCRVHVSTGSRDQAEMVDRPIDDNPPEAFDSPDGLSQERNELLGLLLLTGHSPLISTIQNFHRACSRNTQRGSIKHREMLTAGLLTGRGPKFAALRLLLLQIKLPVVETSLLPILCRPA